jgi:carboxypeptidase T
MTKLFLIFIFMICSQSAHALEFNNYHTLEQVESYLQQIAVENPLLAKVSTLGRSTQGNNLPYLVITKSQSESPQAIYINGGTHGNEKISIEAALGITDYIVKNQDDGNVSAILEQFAIYIQPIVNPDGFLLGSRRNINGLDLNRDFAFPGSDKDMAFKTVETRQIKSLLDSIKLKAAISFHSGIKGVLWPWCHTSEKPKHFKILRALSQKAAMAMGIKTFKQSYDDYPTGGELIDYAYMSQEALAVTFEISQANMPAERRIKAVVNRSVLGAMTYMLSVLDLGESNINQVTEDTTADFSLRTH